MLVSKIPTRVESPHEEGVWFDILKLSWKQLKKARKRAEKENIETARDFGAELLKAFQSDDSTKAAAELIESRKYNEESFDTEQLLLYGVKGWSYEEECNPETLEMLDEETVVWLKQAIIDLTAPPTKVAEEERKKD